MIFGKNWQRTLAPLKESVAVLASLVAYFVGPNMVAAQDVVDWNPNVRGWYIGVDRTIGTSCFMYGMFEGNTALRLQFNRQAGTFQFLIGDVDWQSLEPGKLYALSVQFGNREPWTGDAEAIAMGENFNMLALTVPFRDEKDGAREFINELMRLNGVTVRYDGKQIAELSLRGTYAAAQEMMNCQREIMGATSSTPSDPFGQSPRGNVSDPFD